MTFYSDNQRHLVCWPYSRANLHAMAQALGIKRCWFHAGSYDHYDIPKTRQVEIAARTVVVSPRTILRIVKGEAPMPEDSEFLCRAWLSDEPVPPEVMRAFNQLMTQKRDLQKALTDLLDVYDCPNDCAPDDMTCASNQAQAVLKRCHS